MHASIHVYIHTVYIHALDKMHFNYPSGGRFGKCMHAYTANIDEKDKTVLVSVCMYVFIVHLQQPPI